jgi:hypothetical protein
VLGSYVISLGLPRRRWPAWCVNHVVAVLRSSPLSRISRATPPPHVEKEPPRHRARVCRNRPIIRPCAASRCNPGGENVETLLSCMHSLLSRWRGVDEVIERVDATVSCDVAAGTQRKGVSDGDHNDDERLTRYTPQQRGARWCESGR